MISVVKKSLFSAPARLQRLLLALHGYDFVLQHKAGTQIPVTDTLSRKYLPDTYPEISEMSNLHVHLITQNLPYTDQKLNEVRSKTESDPILIILKDVILQGWPEKRKDCNSQVLEYWNFRDELSVVDNIIYKGNRIIIPQSLRSEMLNLLHKGHPGQERSFRRARNSMFWPNISKDIVNKLQQCSICAEHQRSNPKEPLISHEIPEYPWQVIGSDAFTLDNQDYLLVCDYMSNYFEVEKVKNTNSSTIIKLMKTWFSRHGIPQKIVSDGASYYTSQEFKDFTNELDINHVRSSPQYPKSNGLSESCVKKIKTLLKKCKQDGTDPLIALLELRATPLSIGYAPTEILMGRKIRTFIPMSTKSLTPKTIDYKKIRSLLEEKRCSQKKNYDKHSRSLKPFNVGEKVRILESRCHSTEN